MCLLHSVHDFLWGVPMLALILGIGLYLTVKTGFAQLAFFPEAMGAFFRRLIQRDPAGEGVSSFQALCTALAATVGTGNLVGVAGGICLGGPGAVFWMWICGLVGMATKFAEVTLALGYRTKTGGEFVGGPMYMISRGMGDRWLPLAKAYCFFGVIAALGVGNTTQINALVSGINGVIQSCGGRVSFRRDLAFGLILAVLVGAMLLGGAARIGRTAERLVPLVSGGYILLCLFVLTCRRSFLPGALDAIFRGAFDPKAVTGGLVGSAVGSLRVGCARGVFTNEAGMGTASIAHASADCAHPVSQGLMGIVEVFLDTLVICTMTALVILCSGVPIPYGTDLGGELTVAAFTAVCGDWVSLFIAASLGCFAFATVLGWGLYGGRCGQFLFGPKAWGVMALLQTLTVVLGAVLRTETVWLLAETVNALMAIPNLIALGALSPELVRLTKEYRQNGANSADGGYYADIHQRQPL